MQPRRGYANKIVRAAPPALPGRKPAAKKAGGSSLADFMDKKGGKGSRLSRVQQMARAANRRVRQSSTVQRVTNGGALK